MKEQKITIETFRDLSDGYSLRLLKQEKPSNINQLQYRKYKVTIELIEESDDILYKRLQDMLLDSIGMEKKKRVKDEMEKLK